MFTYFIKYYTFFHEWNIISISGHKANNEIKVRNESGIGRLGH